MVLYARHVHLAVGAERGRSVVEVCDENVALDAEDWALLGRIVLQQKQQCEYDEIACVGTRHRTH